MPLLITQYLIDTLPTQVRKDGVKQPPGRPGSPALLLLRLGKLKVGLTEDVLVLPDHLATSTLLDIWDASGKVFSTYWIPQKPWIPPTITRLKRGLWLCGTRVRRSTGVRHACGQVS